jgi:predicted nuclease with TOPRIM domain
MDAWIYVVLLGAFIMIWAWLKPNKTDKSSVYEVEAILDQFIADMEEENKKWMHRLDELSTEWKKEKNTLEQRLAILESTVSSQALLLTAKSIDYKKSPVEEKEEIFDTPRLDLEDRYKEIFDWVKKGKSVSFIAQKTGMNHGEIELILQLAKQGGAYES